MTPMLPSARLSVSLAEIAAFIALVEHGGFTVAARAMHLSQPGFSGRIIRLERALGVRLVDRGVRRLTLTAEGRAFLPRARDILTSYAAVAGESRGGR
jgi:DNA-binding transcriptional LysR family regulator